MSFISAVDALSALSRTARTAELRRIGVTERELTSATRTGSIIRVRQGVYALPGTSTAVRHAIEHGGVIGCCGAGALHGLWMLAQPAEHHVWMGRASASRLHDDGCRIHWDDGVVRVGELPPVANVLLQIAVCAGEETFFAALESALRQCLLSPSSLAWLRTHLPLHLRWLVAFARSDADSGLESLLRLRLHKLGIRVRTQVRVAGVGEVDFVIDDWLIIEADGKLNHDPVDGALPSHRHKDLTRDAAAAARGYTTLRFDYALIVHDWPAVEAAILGAIAARHALRAA